MFNQRCAIYVVTLVVVVLFILGLWTNSDPGHRPGDKMAPATGLRINLY